MQDREPVTEPSTGWHDAAVAIIERSQKLGLPMQQHGEEILGFVEWYLENYPLPMPVRVIEIGTGHGGTAALWCEMTEGEKFAQVISVDIPLGVHGGDSAASNDVRDAKLSERYPGLFHAIRADSQLDSTRGQVASVLGGLVDILFIDGDHRYECAKRDFELYSSLVRPGGVILFHDIVATPFYAGLQVNVKQAWDELPPGEKREWSINHPEWGGLGAWIKPE